MTEIKTAGVEQITKAVVVLLLQCRRTS